MICKEKNIDEHYRYPRPAIVIIFVHCVTKFSEAVFAGVLPLFLVDKLKFDESKATVTFHVYHIIQYIFSLAGGIIGDTTFGRYRVLLYSYALIALGLIVLSVGSVPTLHLPIYELTFLALGAAYIGFGAREPCTHTIGGDQFKLPQQEKQLSLFFVQQYAFGSIAITMAYFLSPILRKDINCYGELTCYPLVFVIPAAIVLLGLLTFFASKRMFTLRNSQGNVTLKIVRCIFHALSRKLKSKEKKEHWLYHASDEYEADFLEDIKLALQTMVLFLPTIMFAAANAAKATTVTFQASRMNGEVAGYLIKPDQIHIVESVFRILALPVFHYYVYPLLAKYLRLDTHLKKISIGLTLAALSYYASSIVELNLETTYAPKPMEGYAHLRIYNALDCKTTMNVNGQTITIDELAMWQNLTVPVTDNKSLKYSADFEKCHWQHELPKQILGNFEVTEKQADSLVLTERGLSYKFIDNNSKSRSGNVIVRALIHMDSHIKENMTLKVMSNGGIVKEELIYKTITESELWEINHGTYDLYLNDQKIQSNVALKHGGVYTLLGYISNWSKNVRIVTLTQPNSMSIFWILPELLLLTTSMVIIIPLANEFLYAQAPSSMKGFMQSYWMLMMAIGQFVVIAITNLKFLDRKVYVFLLYAVLMTIATIIFALLSRAYKYRRIPSNHADNSQQDNAG